VWLFGYPFAGELKVSKRPFLVDIAIFESRYADMPPSGDERASKAAAHPGVP
jgi:hypothetical protein